MATATIEDEIKEIEDEIRATQYNKHTEYHIGKLKAKIANLREKQEIASRKSKAGEGFDVKKKGNSSVALVGFPSVGKSTLLNRLTNTESKVAAYEFTTLDVVPGMMEYKGAKIQILDLPGIISGASMGKGRGKEVLAVVRNADLILLIIDPFHLDHVKVLEKELYNVGIRLNREKPKVTIKRKIRGGITLASTVKLTKISENAIRGVLNAKGIFNADILCCEDIDIDEFLDVVMGNRKYVKALKVVNKIDLCTDMETLKSCLKDFIAVSADKNVNIDELKERIFKELDFISIYTKPLKGESDNVPLIIRRNSTVGDVCDMLHRDMKKKFKYALVYGDSAKFNGQMVGLEHVLKDKDTLTIVTRI